MALRHSWFFICGSSNLRLDAESHLRHAISGTAHINTEDELLDNPLALAILIDVFSERGYHAGVDIHRIEIPDRIELATGKLMCRTKKVYRIEIRFQGSEIRRG